VTEEAQAARPVLAGLHTNEVIAVRPNRDGLTFVVVVALLTAMAALLYFVILQSNMTFGRGITLAERAFAEGAEAPHVLIQQVYALGMAHEVVTFKATALFVGALVAILGALFVLRTAETAYDARLEAAGWKVSLGTSSPGLVMISLGCALVAVPMLSKAHAPSDTVDAPEPTTRYDDLLEQLQKAGSLPTATEAHGDQR
jgi:hypothetical protein